MDYNKNFDLIDSHNQISTISGTNYSVITDMMTEPVNADLFKKHARIDFDTDDDLILLYIKAARIFLEQYTMKSFGPKLIEFTATKIPDRYHLMLGYTHVGDLLSPGGSEVNIRFQTNGVVDDLIRIAICRYAAGLYMSRENVIDSKLSSTALIDQAKLMVQSYRNIILF